MSNTIRTAINFDSCVPTEQGNQAGWWIYISIGDWDTYKEDVYLNPTKPTHRELRQAIKQFKLNHLNK